MSAHHEMKTGAFDVFEIYPYDDGFCRVLGGLDVWTYTWDDRNEMTGFSEEDLTGTVIA